MRATVKRPLARNFLILPASFSGRGGGGKGDLTLGFEYAIIRMPERKAL